MPTRVRPELGWPFAVPQALRQEGVAVPTDILGIVYIPLDEGGAWKTLLARELAAAGFDLDPRKLKAASRARRSATSRNA